MKRLLLTVFVFFLAAPLVLTACWPFDGGGGSGCQAHYVYDHIAYQGQMLVVTDREQTGNNSGKDLTLTLTAQKSTTVTVSADAGVDADLGAIFAGVKAQLHATVSFSVTAGIINSPMITIPDGAIGYGDYGVFVQLAAGHLYSPNCHQDYGAQVSSRIPVAAGWCVWVTGESPAKCESVAPAPTLTPTPPASTVFIGSYNGFVYGLRASDGSQLWHFQTGKTVVSSAAIANGVIYLGSLDHFVYALRASDGSQLWRFQTGGYVISNPAVVNGVVYAGSDDNFLYALRASDGSQLWRFQASGAVRSLLVVTP